MAKQVKAKSMEEILLQELKDWRTKKRQETGWSAFAICNDETLKMIVGCHPKTKEELSRIKGIGEKRLEQYGDEILAIVNAAAEADGENQDVAEIELGNKKSTQIPQPKQPYREGGAGSVWDGQESAQLLKEFIFYNNDIATIADIHKRTEGAINSRLLVLLKSVYFNLNHELAASILKRNLSLIELLREDVVKSTIEKISSQDNLDLMRLWLDDLKAGQHTGRLIEVYPEFRLDCKDERSVIIKHGRNELRERLRISALENYIGQEISLEKSTDNKELLFFYNNGTTVCVISCPKQNSRSNDWSPQEQALLEEKVDSYSDEELASFFGREKEFISSKTGTFRTRSGFAALQSADPLPEIRLNNSGIESIGSAINTPIHDKTNGHDYFGIAFKAEDASHSFLSKSQTLFGLSEKEFQKIVDECSQDGGSHLFPRDKIELAGIADNIKYVWIKTDSLEGRFTTYSFAYITDESLWQDSKEKCKEYSFNLISFIKSELAKNLNDQIEQEKERTRYQAMKSSIAYIMARNMSHNLGSHYMQYTKDDLWKLASKENLDYAQYFRGGSKTLDYIQGRMSYLSYIAADDKLPYRPVHFLTDIFYPLILDEDPYEEEKATKNYFLSNLVRSEKYSRNDGEIGKLDLKLSYFINGKYILRNEITSENNCQKAEYDNLQVALPGGNVGIHAFYNILENFIRNSAKYHWGETPRPKDLTITVCLRLVDHKNERQLEVVIHDSKGNANEKVETISLLDKMNGALGQLVFLNDDMSINQSSKGLKEMLLSSFWISSNEFDDDFCKLIQKFNDADKSSKEGILKDQGFTYTTIPQESDKASLGIKFTMPIYTPVLYVDDFAQFPSKIKSDVIVCKKNGLQGSPYARTVITESLPEIAKDAKDAVEESTDSPMYRDTCALYAAITKNLGDDNFDSYILNIDGLEPQRIWGGGAKMIMLEDHMSDNVTTETFLDYWGNYAYVETKSGGNDTQNIWNRFTKGRTAQNGAKYNRWEDKYFSLKVKEAALTRITIIDERIFNSVRWISTPQNKQDCIDFPNSQLELSLKNVQVLNYFPDDNYPSDTDQVEAFPILRGNKYRSEGHLTDAWSADFLAIHVSLIEKMLSDNNILTQEDYCGPISDNKTDRVTRLMAKLREVFSKNNPSHLRIAIDSGRGKLSDELKDALSGYPLIDITSLTKAFNESKLRLAEEFYCLKYDTSYE